MAFQNVLFRDYSFYDIEIMEIIEFSLYLGWCYYFFLTFSQPVYIPSLQKSNLKVDSRASVNLWHLLFLPEHRGFFEEKSTRTYEISSPISFWGSHPSQGYPQIPHFSLHMLLTCTDKCSSSASQFPILPKILRVIKMILEIADRRIHFVCNLTKFFILFPKHCYIRVIIPWDKSLMSDSSQEGSIGNTVFNIIFSTYPVQFLQHIQL